MGRSLAKESTLHPFWLVCVHEQTRYWWQTWIQRYERREITPDLTEKRG